MGGICGSSSWAEAQLNGRDPEQAVASGRPQRHGRGERDVRRSPWAVEEFARLSLEAIDRTFLPGTEQEVNFVVDEFELCMGSRVLDLGCGVGRHCIELAGRGIEVVGVDISQFMLDEAVARAQRSQVLELIFTHTWDRGSWWTLFWLGEDCVHFCSCVQALNPFPENLRARGTVAFATQVATYFTKHTDCFRQRGWILRWEGILG
jgi:SAM-dependent methyltransferase